MATTRIFRSGNSLAVRLPKEFRFKSAEIEIFRRGDEVILRDKPKGLRRAYEIMRQFPEDMVEAIRSDGPPQKRKGL